MTDGPTPCSILSRSLGEPLAGTAPAATAWLCIEQPGPWGRDAVVESSLDPALGAELLARAGGTGVRVSLVRRPGRSNGTRTPARRNVFLASTWPGRTWLEHLVVTDPKELLRLDFAAFGAGTPSGLGQRVEESVFFVCTNGRRDRCCAEVGRPVAAALEARYGERVWECTHTGGHRLAPTGVTLPTGYLYGRLDVPAAEAVVATADAGAVVTDACRGRSTWSPPGQVAELAVREHTGETGVDALTVESVTPSKPAASVSLHAVTVRHTDGRSWRVDVEERELAPARPTSCGKDPVLPTGVVASAIHPA